MSGLAFHASNLIILNHNPIHPELIRGSLVIVMKQDSVSFYQARPGYKIAYEINHYQYIVVYSSANVAGIKREDILEPG